MEKIRKPIFKVLYEDKDITRDLKEFILAVRYKDNAGGILDEIEIEVDNRDRRWFKSWFPDKYDRVRLFIGYEGENLLNCGKFLLDKKVYRGFPETLKLKGMAIPYENEEFFKTAKSRVFENTTLKKVVSDVAIGGNLQPLIVLKEDVNIKRIEQKNVSDSKFLFELAKKFDCVFKVMDEKVVFSSWDSLMEANASFEIKDEDIIGYMIDDNIHNLYKEAVVEYFDKDTNSLKTYSFKDPYVKFGDTLKINEKAEDLNQAKIIAKSALRANNLLGVKISLDVVGDTKYMAGVNVLVKGFGNYDGKYFINSATHVISGEGYKIKLELMQCWSY